MRLAFFFNGHNNVFQDPFAGSYFVEALTFEIESRAAPLIEKVDQLGGVGEAIAFMKSAIEESAGGYQERYGTGQDIVVGVNKFVEDDVKIEELLRVDPSTEREQIERLKAFKSDRDQELTRKTPGSDPRGRPRHRPTCYLF